MEPISKLSRMDFGRLVAVAVFSCLMTVNFLGVAREIETFFPIDITKVLDLTHNALAAGFYILVICVYFLRTSASATTRSLSAKLIALVGTFIPFVIPLLGHARSSAAMLTASSLTMLGGTVFALAALGALGKSFSIIPQVRNLVVRGPYSMVRHPLYLGEIIGTLGLAMAGISIYKILVFLLLVACQVYRAIEEEKLLSAAFPEYADYALRTARFIPGLF